jgi:hypothetical protein
MLGHVTCGLGISLIEVATDSLLSLEERYEDMITSTDSGVALHPMGKEDTCIDRITWRHSILAAEKRVEKVELGNCIGIPLGVGNKYRQAQKSEPSARN